jgi:HK97 family phage major capsid protein
LTPSTRLATLTPKSLIFQVTVSRRLMMQTSADMERVLRTELLRNTMRAIDEAGLRGAGANAPAGLLNDPALQVNSAGSNGAAPTWAHLVEMEHQVGLRAGDMAAPAFLTSPSIRKRLRTTPRGAGLDYILADTATTVMGQPLRISSMVPDNLTKGSAAGVCSAMVFGDWSEVIVGFWGPAAVDVLVDGFTSANTGQIKLTVRAEVAVATRDIKAFSAYTDLLSA